MKSNLKVIDIQQDFRIRVSKRNAYHQAGHAAAIYLGNKQKQLPEVHFQIVIKPHEQDRLFDRFAGIYNIYSKLCVTVEGGRLIQSLSLSYAEATRNLTLPQIKQYRYAFETDVINLLAGSMAEAKYVASRDNEVFNAKLFNLNAMRFYNGSPDLKIVNEYMERLLPNKQDREKKLADLFMAAFKFVNKASNWLAISTLAEFILSEPIGIVSCEKSISLLESRLQA